MELAFPVVWCCRGYALKGERVVGKLEGTIKTLYCFGNVEVGSFVFMWCIWREWKIRNFEDRETALLELKKMLFQFLYTWIVAFNSLHVSNFS
jgi:hypothetical protein